MSANRGDYRTTTQTVLPEHVLMKMRRSNLFKNFDDNEFESVYKLMQPYEVKQGATLIHLGGNDTNLYIIRRGRAISRAMKPGGMDAIVKQFHPGEVLNELSFLTGKPNDMTIEVADPLDLWVITRPDWQALVAGGNLDNEHIGYPESAQTYLKANRHFEGQRPGEMVLWYGKKHWWVFLSSAWLSWLAFLLMAVVVATAFFLPEVRALLLSSLGILAFVAVTFFALVVFVWWYVDWQNDFYAVTDQRVVHRERVLLLYDTQDECPISKVQNVNVKRPSWISTAIDVGDVVVETMGSRANITFSWVSHPDKAAKSILENQQRAKIEGTISERAKMRATLRREMQLETAAAPPPQAKSQARVDARKMNFGQRLGFVLAQTWNHFLPKMREQVEGDIVYHKHWVLLLFTTGLPLVNLVAYIAILIALPFILPDIAPLVFRTVLVIPVIVVGLLLIGWLVWNYEDWRNDTFILKPDKVIDSDRTPFGLRGTDQKTAALSNIQNVEYKTNGLIDNMFNMGDVVINTGGGEGNQLVFERVWNPRRVQRDIVDRIESIQGARKEAEAEARRREVAEWLGIYDELNRLHRGREI
jgi:uncharacterized membrane protein YdbT with pleckstrin-like domain